MTEIDPAELSAYLDSELPPERMRQIEALLAEDAGLRAEHEALKRLDAAWREAGAAGMFVPMIELPSAKPARSPAPWLLATVALLLLVRLGGKVVDAVGPSLLLNGVALAVALAVVLAMGRRREAAMG